ncbi:aldose 1-epimerase [Massilia atriviolacea]|uniref:Aldose 1-epimerase n=1 Tax=Massilia atriviolacea TaxID=2495579 RepID=A0A430HEW6_9BURK|nr:aldose 1-epimerase [Massilia atriviolacea]
MTKLASLVLRNAQLSAEILPGFGGALSRLDWIGGAAPVPVLRPYAGGEAAPRPNQLACFPLLPWSNRMAGGFSHGGQRYDIAPNREGDPFPIHGEGWQRPWTVAFQSASQALLMLERRDGVPFSYRASLEYALRGNTLVVTLEATNTGALALPFGLGLHPWMPRAPGTTLQAAAREVWMAGADKLPAHAQAIPEAWSFERARALPDGPIDNIFEGWDGKARIRWPENGLNLEIAADGAYYIVYAPAGGDFFCFEPVDHLINAHNMAGGPARHGLTVLAPGQRLRRTFSFAVT